MRYSISLSEFNGQIHIVVDYVGNMGRELPKDSAESHEMEDVNISDLELVYHVREALTTVQSVSVSPPCKLRSTNYYYYFLEEQLISYLF